MIKYPIALTMTVTVLGAFAQSPKIPPTNLDRIDTLAQRLVKEQHIAGASILLIKDGNAIYAKAGISTGLGSKDVLAERITQLAKQPLLHDPGTAFTYSLNTDVLDPKENLIGLVFTQEYMPKSYWDLGYLFKNVIYSGLEG